MRCSCRNGCGLFRIVPAVRCAYILFMAYMLTISIKTRITIAAMAILLCAAGVRAQPFNEWVQGTLTGTHSVLDLKINPLRPDTLYAATLPGTVFRSANRGATWAEVPTGLPGAIRTLSINPANPAILYAGTDDGVYRTANQGTAWAANGLTGENVNRLLVMPDTSTHVFAGTPGGLRRTRNSGTLWDSLAVDTLTTVSVRAIAVNPLRTDTLYVGTAAHGVYRSRNRGQTWTQINTGLNNQNIAALIVHPTQPDTLYAATSGGGIFRSTSGGATWEAVNNGLSNLDIATLAIAPNRPAILYAGTRTTGQVFRSSDHAASWFDITNTLPGGLVGGLVVHPDSASVVYAGLNHIYRIRQRGLVPRLLLQTGEEPAALGLADFNSDGQADAVVANAGAGTLSLFVNEEQGTFFFSQRVVAGGEPVSLAIGDINRDGRMDIAVGNRATRVVTVLSNNGSGAFPSRLDLFVGQVPCALALADIDGDARPDILAATRAPGNAVSLFLNTGANQFATQREFPTGRDPVALAVADINNNGLPDLITADREDGRISILLNQGGGRFAAPQTIATGGEPVGLVARDFDLDGRADIAVIARNTEELVLLHNLGANAFATRRYPLEFQPIAIRDGDIDRDGYPDLAISGDGHAVQTLINDGRGGFRFPLQTLDQTTSARALHLSDMDADGRVDLLSIQTDTRSLFIRRNDLPREIKSPAPPRGVTAADVQADLGGRIRISWHIPKVDEDSNRVTAYRVLRANAREGPYAMLEELRTNQHAPTTTDSLTVFRAYVDSTATVNRTYFFYLISVGQNDVQSVSSDTVSAASRAQPFFEFDFSRNGIYHAGDTVQVSVSVVPLDYAVSGVSLYLNYSPRAFAIVDADQVQPNIQPVQPGSAVLQGNQILENRLHQSQQGAINYSFASLTASDTARIGLGTIRLVALRDTLSHIAVIDSPQVNRRTAVIERGSGNVILPYPGSGRYAINVRGIQLNSQIVLQGRSQSQNTLLRVDVRRPNGTPLPDSVAYNPPNDLDQNPANGVQLQSDASGRFSLVQVPAGRHAVFVKSFHTLRTRVQGDSLTVASPSPATFRISWRSSLGTVVNDTLRGGDANDDNRVNLADFGILAAHFGTSGIAPSHPAWAADFNGDGTVNLADFGILASNFGEVGMGHALSFKPALGPNVFAMEPREAGIYALVLTAPIAGFSTEVSASETNAEIFPGEMLSGRALWIARPVAEGRVRVAAHAIGATTLPEGMEIARIRAENPVLQNLLVIDLEGRLLANGLSDPQKSAGPLQPALYPAFPNPFNPSTAIRYDVSEPSDVILEIYNLTGQKVRTLISEPKSPGAHTATWDGTTSDGRMLASGVYIFRIAIGTFIDANKIVLIK